MKRSLLFLGIVFLALSLSVLSGCSQSNTVGDPSTTETTEPGATTTTSPGSVTGENVNVEIIDFTFKPDPITIARGGTVIWTNKDSVSHTVVADQGGFESGNLNTGDTFTHTFNNAGTFTYHCGLHPNMTGTVVVK